MFKINTYIYDKNGNTVNGDSDMVNIRDKENIKTISHLLSNKYNRYLVNVSYNNEILEGASIITTEPWMTYVILIQDFIEDGYAEEHDLTQPVKYYFKKQYHELMIFGIKPDGEEACEYKLPENDFLKALSESLFEYMEYMKLYKEGYYNYWMIRYSKAFELIKHKYIINK